MSRSVPGRLAALAAALTLFVAGCGAAEDPLPPDGGASDSTMTVYSVSEALAVAEDGSLHVVGLLIDDGSGWRLCELVLESYPPQCGGDWLVVERLDASTLPLEEASGVRWQTQATLVGEVDGDTLTVTGSAAAS